MKAIVEAKYVHIMTIDSLIFNKQIIEMINNNTEFDMNNHLFIVGFKDVYEQNKQYNNVILDEEVCNKPKAFNKYAKKCNFIFLHSYFSNKRMLLINPRYLKKIIWIEWGHDLYIKHHFSKKLSFKEKILGFPRRTGKRVLIKLKTFQKKHFFGIGLGPKYDIIEVKKIYKDKLKVFMTPYGYIKNNKRDLEKVIKQYNNVPKDYVKVMVGHSAYEYSNHIEILHSLEKYKNEKIIISLVLAYGDMNYAEKVKKEAIRIFGTDKVEIIDKLMDKKEYIKHLCSVDIAIITYKTQAGMGNLYNLLYLGKKIFLSENSYIKLITKLESIETYNYEDIYSMDFDMFAKPVNNPQRGMECSSFKEDERNYITQWKSTIDELEEYIKRRD